jgi:hypothetical protein
MRNLIALFAVVALLAGCHPGPVVGTGPRPPDASGTIAGIVATDTNTPLAGRRVAAIETTSGQRYEATTGVNGGYTIKVPEGTYRLELELRAGETLTAKPGETRINKSDLDPKRNFVVRAG